MEKPTALPMIEQDQPKVACEGLLYPVSIPLEVDTAAGSNHFDPTQLEAALQTTLSDEYTFCVSPSRRLERSNASNA